MRVRREQKKKSLVLRISRSLDTLVKDAAKRERKSKSAYVRDILQGHVGGLRGKQRPTLMELAGDLIGSVRGGPDLSTNPKYMEDFGK